MRSVSFALAACLLCAACGRPDSEVFGGVPAPSASVPDAVIPKVRSAIHGAGTVTNLRDGTTAQRWIILLSSADNLCDSLQRFPNYLKDRGSPEDYAALALLTPPGIVGDFYLSAQAAPNGQADASLLAAFQGGSTALYPGIGGDASVADFSPSGEARGSFSLVVGVGTSGQGFVYGRYKTSPCSAIGQAFIPRYR